MISLTALNSTHTTAAKAPELGTNSQSAPNLFENVRIFEIEPKL